MADDVWTEQWEIVRVGEDLNQCYGYMLTLFIVKY